MITNSDQQTKKVEYYPSLNGIRAYAALGIILMHVLTNISVKPTENYFTRLLIPFFSDFTLLFMIISAFSICCGYYVKFKERKITLDAFYKKRYIRILPFFAFLCILDFCLKPNLETFYQVFSNLTLCFGLLPAHKIDVIGVGWFLGIVFLFYLLFPFFTFLLDNKNRAIKSLFISILFIFFAMSSKFVTGHLGKENFIFCAPFFLSGGVIYLFREQIIRITKKHKIIITTAITLITISFFLFKQQYTYKTLYLSELILFSSWIIYSIATPIKLLTNKALKYLSDISLEIYLSHMIIYRVVEKIHLEQYIQQKDFLYIATSLLTILGVICFAHIMKYYIINRIEKSLNK